ncbi:hypothetical protein [Paenibacillus sp. SYP-B4298]|uniref:hypothetical protein n=1 Tax=Paenibacillus sp. SYP-B4298 TaxID=2996034 RepID=UPI0022DD4DF5|nr:hypothetical protein [Paenibacillus sp. SYP-B4298]
MPRVLFFSFVLILICLPVSAAIDEGYEWEKNRSITIEAVNKDGEPTTGFLTLRVLHEEKSSVIFNGELNENGAYTYDSIIPEGISAPGEVVDVVYEAIVTSQNGEVAVEHFVVSHDRVDKKNFEIKSKNTFEILNSNPQIITMIVSERDTTNDVSQITATPSQSNINVGITSWGPNCTGDPVGNYHCVDSEVYYTKPTKIGTVNVANGETVNFSLSSSARVSIQRGVKLSPASNWSANGSVTLTADTGTTVDYSISGQCRIFWGSSECNLQRDLYANYQYRYSKISFYNQFGYLFTEYYVVPIALVGPSPVQGNEWSYNSTNGYTLASAKSQPQWFTVYQGASNTKSYGSERTFSGGVEVSTPVGSFVGSITTAYKNAHTIKWSTSLTNTTFYHYSLDSSGSMFYVTK